MRLHSISADLMAVIRVPKTPKSAYNPQRPAGTLLQSQLKHLEWAVRPAAARTAKTFRIKPALTEEEAAARIARLNEQLHVQATAPKGVVPPPAVTATPVSPPAKPRKRLQSKSMSKSRSKARTRAKAPARRAASRRRR
jgi:hypothetical protein